MKTRDKYQIFTKFWKANTNYLPLEVPNMKINFLSDKMLLPWVSFQKSAAKISNFTILITNFCLLNENVNCRCENSFKLKFHTIITIFNWSQLYWFSVIEILSWRLHTSQSDLKRNVESNKNNTRKYENSRHVSSIQFYLMYF